MDYKQWDTNTHTEGSAIPKDQTTSNCRNTPSTTSFEGQNIVDAPGTDGNASMPEHYKRPNPWRKMTMIKLPKTGLMQTFLKPLPLRSPLTRTNKTSHSVYKTHSADIWPDVLSDRALRKHKMLWRRLQRRSRKQNWCWLMTDWIKSIISAKFLKISKVFCPYNCVYTHTHTHKHTTHTHTRLPVLKVPRTSNIPDQSPFIPTHPTVTIRYTTLYNPQQFGTVPTNPQYIV
jgi:hypothetical protein